MSVRAPVQIVKCETVRYEQVLQQEALLACEYFYLHIYCVRTWIAEPGKCSESASSMWSA